MFNMLIDLTIHTKAKKKFIFIDYVKDIQDTVSKSLYPCNCLTPLVINEHCNIICPNCEHKWCMGETI